MVRLPEEFSLGVTPERERERAHAHTLAHECMIIVKIWWHICSKQELWARRNVCCYGTAVFSVQSTLHSHSNRYAHNNRGIVGRGVLCGSVQMLYVESQNTPVAPQAIWPIAKSLIKRNRPKAPSAIHSPSGPIFYPIDKAYITAVCLENQFTVQDFCDCDCRWHVEAKVEALLATINEDTPVNFWPCDVSKEIQSTKLGKACGFMAFQEDFLCI
jgi:hypothetical protein